jgi:hypothetical protein
MANTFGRVYKIIHNQSDIVYVGSTMSELRFRWQNHKAQFQRFLQNCDHCICSIYPFFEKFGIENFKIVLIKEYEVCDKKHLEAKEQLWINKLRCINQRNLLPVPEKISKQIYYERNKDRIEEYRKQYYQNNKEAINLKARLYHEQNKAKVNDVSRKHYASNIQKYQEYGKKYREENKEQLRDKKRNYYETNKKTILENQAQKLECECGATVTRNHLARHKRSKKHQESISEH